MTKNRTNILKGMPTGKIILCNKDSRKENTVHDAGQIVNGQKINFQYI